MANGIYCNAAKRQISRIECYHSKNDPDCQHCKHLKEKIKPSGHLTSIPKERREKQKTKMKMSEYDRRMATERSKEFVKDRENLIGLFKKEIGAVSKETSAFYEELCTKWDLKPSGEVYIDGPPVEPQYLLSKMTLLHKQRGPLYIRGSEQRWGGLYTDGSEPEVEVREREPIEQASWLDFGTPEENWLHVNWRIDISRPEKELRSAFTSKIKEYKQMVAGPERKQRRRKTKYDPWEIWDLHHKSGLTLNKIAIKKSGKNPPRGRRSPAHNDELWPPYKQVQNAHNRCIAKIRAVEKEAHRRMKGPEKIYDLLQNSKKKEKGLPAKQRKRKSEKGKS